MQIRFTGFDDEIRMRKRYPSDITEAQWARIAPLFEKLRRGRPRRVQVREILNAIFYVMKNGCAWRALPHDFPKWQTVFVQRLRWSRQGLLARAAEYLPPRGHRPSVGIIDSTFVESAYGDAQCAPSGYKRATGHSIHVLIDKHSRVRGHAVLPANSGPADAALA